MKTVMLLVAALSIVAWTVPADAGSTCTTTCTRYSCTTNCY